MNAKQYIDVSICKQVEESLAQIEKEHDVMILQAIESGSRAWGFPSPDSDYDVRFIYAHSRDWYLQLTEEQDVIELPISDELDIAGWDLRKALNLAKKGNAVIQEWMISPIVYKQANEYEELYKLVNKAFNPISTYHHYRSMAKKAHDDIQKSENKKLKRFFYYARATLSAKWILEKQTMPSIVFVDLLDGLITNQAQRSEIETLISRKETESEKSTLKVSDSIWRTINTIYDSLDGDVRFEDALEVNISNDQFRAFIKRLN